MIATDAERSARHDLAEADDGHLGRAAAEIRPITSADWFADGEAGAAIAAALALGMSSTTAGAGPLYAGVEHGPLFHRRDRAWQRR